MNIVLIRSCTNCCPYCFEASTRDSTKPDFMTLEDARKVGVWASSDRLQSIRLLGGEPFIHPSLRGIIDIFLETCPTAKLTVFTGGVLPLGALDNIRPNDCSILVNVNEARDYSSKQNFEKVLAFIDHALQSGFEVGLGFNVWRTNFDPIFMPELAFSLGRKGFRWTVANPSLGAASSIVNRDDFKQLSIHCMNLLRQSTQRGLMANLDCPLPLCFFSDADVAWLSRYQPGVLSNLGVCSPPIDVLPELDAIRCFGVSSCAREPISNHKSPSALRTFFTQQLDQDLLMRQAVFPECNSCEHFHSARCQGGCFGWRSASPSVGAILAERLYKMLQAGRDRQVIDTIEASSRWFVSPLSLYLGALAARRLGDELRCRRYALTAIGGTPAPSLLRRLRTIIYPQTSISGECL